MSNNRKKSKAVPVVLVITLLVAALAACGFLLKPIVTDPIRQASVKEYNALLDEVDKQNAENQQAYDQAVLDLQNQARQPKADPAWPTPQPDKEWEIIDLTGFPLQNVSAEHKTRAEVMNNGLLLVNAFHERPADFNDADPNIVSIGRYLGGNSKVQVKDYNLSLFKVAADALLKVITDAKADGMDHYMVDEAYRSYSTQEALFNKKMEALASKYKDENARAEAAAKEVNRPGTSEYNTGLSFTLRLYDRNDAEVAVPKYSTTPQAAWMNENCWKYGIVFRFPLQDWPTVGTLDKTFKTGVSMKLGTYRYVGEGSAAVMHLMDFCLEEYIEYLMEHSHIAVYHNGELKYEIYRQAVGDATEFDVLLTPAESYISSLDNMGGVITVFTFKDAE